MYSLGMNVITYNLISNTQQQPHSHSQNEIKLNISFNKYFLVEIDIQT